MFFSQQSKTECLFSETVNQKSGWTIAYLEEWRTFHGSICRNYYSIGLYLKLCFEISFTLKEKNKWSVPSHFRVWVVCLFRFAPQSNLSRDLRNSSTPFILLRVSPMMAALSEFCRLRCKMYNKCVRLELRNFVIEMSEMLLAPDVLHHEWKLMYNWWDTFGYLHIFWKRQSYESPPQQPRS